MSACQCVCVRACVCVQSVSLLPSISRWTDTEKPPISFVRQVFRVQMHENDNFLCSSSKRYKICPKMEIPTTKYLADYLYVVHEDVPFRYYRKVSVVVVVFFLRFLLFCNHMANVRLLVTDLLINVLCNFSHVCNNF